MRNRIKAAVVASTIILLLIAPAGAAFANEGYWGGSGGNLKPQTSEDVVLEEELVQIWLYAQGYEVRTDYIFYNSGPSQDVYMGFPSELGRLDLVDPATGESIDDELHQFQAYADGAMIPSQTKLVTEQIPGSSDSLSIRWYVQEVPFSKGQRRLMTTRYAANYSTMGDDSEVPEGVWLQVSYILQTGASWKDKIGKATVRVYESEGFAYEPKNEDDWRPAPFARIDDGWELVLTDFEPEDTAGTYRTGPDNVFLSFFTTGFTGDGMETRRDNPSPEGLTLALPAESTASTQAPAKARPASTVKKRPAENKADKGKTANQPVTIYIVLAVAVIGIAAGTVYAVRRS